MIGRWLRQCRIAYHLRRAARLLVRAKRHQDAAITLRRRT